MMLRTFVARSSMSRSFDTRLPGILVLTSSILRVFFFFFSFKKEIYCIDGIREPVVVVEILEAVRALR